MRHTFISMMLQFGNSPLVLYKMVGYTNSEMIYKAGNWQKNTQNISGQFITRLIRLITITNF